MKYKIKYSKQASFFTLVCFFAFINNSTGFDFYGHSVSYYYFNETLNHSDILFTGIVQPRYLLLSLVYEMASRIGIPLGYIALVLLLIPVYIISRNIVSKYNKKGREYFSLYQAGILILLLFPSIWYSSLSLVVLWISAFIVTREKKYLIGSLFHPIGILMALIVLFFTSRRDLIYYIGALLLFYFVLYVLTTFQLLSAVSFDNIRFGSDKNILELMELSFVKKSNEFFLIAIVIGLTWILQRESKKVTSLKLVNSLMGIGNRIFLTKKIFNLFLVLFYFIFLLYMMGKPTLIYSLLTLHINDVIYASWFDWGEKGVRLSYNELYALRYWQ
jgi:hypothetical protein